ncbi:hypothetical protein L3X38_000930 [Prunus dulcis]|uniref:Uncharacterized protein n=1 Tax=Prunus dulcis TaxID=3755 RepID=A0AAD4WRM4_PRUDU|nr:hypothetical protein L3X38_000930 [Prunus dulcis]
MRPKSLQLVLLLFLGVLLVSTSSLGVDHHRSIHEPLPLEAANSFEQESLPVPGGKHLKGPKRKLANQEYRRRPPGYPAPEPRHRPSPPPPAPPPLPILNPPPPPRRGRRPPPPNLYPPPPLPILNPPPPPRRSRRPPPPDLYPPPPLPILNPPPPPRRRRPPPQIPSPGSGS